MTMTANADGRAAPEAAALGVLTSPAPSAARAHPRIPCLRMLPTFRRAIRQDREEEDDGQDGAAPSSKNWNVWRIHLVGHHVGVEAAAGRGEDDVEDLEHDDGVVMVTMISEPLIMGTMILKNFCRSLAPSRPAASVISVGTPLMAAESTTMAKPVCSQMRMTMSRNVLRR